jgi:hypothetical protein
MYIILIVKIWNVLDVNRLGDYICVCLTRVALTELETVGNDSCSIPEEEEEEMLCYSCEHFTCILILFIQLHHQPCISCRIVNICVVITYHVE